MGNSSKRDARVFTSIETRMRIIELRKQGLTLREIADEMGCAISTVHKQIADSISLATDKLSTAAEQFRMIDAEGIAEDLERTEYDLGRIEARLELLDQTDRFAPTNPEELDSMSPDEIALAKLGISEPATNILAKLIDARTKLIAKRTDLRARRAKMFGVDAPDKVESTTVTAQATTPADAKRVMQELFGNIGPRVDDAGSGAVDRDPPEGPTED